MNSKAYPSHATSGSRAFPGPGGLENLIKTLLKLVSNLIKTLLNHIKTLLKPRSGGGRVGRATGGGRVDLVPGLARAAIPGTRIDSELGFYLDSGKPY
jgi:hypothetical protein